LASSSLPGPFLEALMLIAAEAVWIKEGSELNSLTTRAMLGWVALAVGLQSGSMLSLKLPGIVTTYITGTWTLLVSGLVKTDVRRARLHENTASFEERQFIQIIFLATYFLSAVASGCAFRYLPEMIGVITAAPILLTAIYGALRA
jgi:uncharacterized membrane protein YoaK (UPF0700 family)